MHDEVYALIKKYGAVGVNQLSKELNVPLSTMQKYMDKNQTYFKKNHARKWVLPEESVNSDMAAVSGNYSTIIESQLMSMNALIDTLMSQFRATVTLIETQKPPTTSVADKAPNINKTLVEVDKNINEVYNAINKYKSKIPEEYRELLKNVDLHLLYVEMGTKFVSYEFNTELSSLLLEKADKLSDSVVEILQEYQKEA